MFFYYYGIFLSFMLSSSILATEENQNHVCPTEEKVGHISDIFSEFDDYSYTDEPEQTPIDDDADTLEITENSYTAYIKKQIISLVTTGFIKGCVLCTRLQEKLRHLYDLLI